MNSQSSRNQVTLFRSVRHDARLQGFTLVELLVSIAVVAILMAVAVPSFESTMQRAAVRGASSDLGADLNLARSEAIRTGGRVSVCPRQSPQATACGEDWRNGWLVFRENGTSAIGVFDAGDRLLREHEALDRRLTLARTVGAGALTFLASGALQPVGGASTARFALRATATGVKGRDLDVSVIGRLSTAEAP